MSLLTSSPLGDVYSLHRSRDEVLGYLDRVDPQEAAAARRRYSALTPYLDEPQAYGAHALATGRNCEDAVVEQLVALLDRRLAYTVKEGSEKFFDAEQNARVISVLPSRPDSWERVFLDAGHARSLTNWRADPALASDLSLRRLERAIGVIYRPESERQSHYFAARLSRQFDAMVWFEETSAVTPLAGAPAEGAPDVYPFGL